MTARSSPSPPPGPAHLLAPAGASPPLTVEVPRTLTAALWRFLRQHLADRARNGGVVRPDERALCDALRAAYLAQLQASGHPIPQIPDITSPSTQARMGRELVRTAELADALGVTDRHARRLARAAGLQQARRGWWRTEDVARLIKTARSRR